MGSRRRRHAALAAVALAVAVVPGGCTHGAPPGFSQGDRWVVPLIGPLEDGLLLVPAMVNGRGPYVFAVDPDAHVSIVDAAVVKEIGAATGEGPKMLDESDTEQNRFYAEILAWGIGTLDVKGPKPAQIVPVGTFDADGRRIHGVLGRDIIADSLVFAFDRERGVVTLSTQKGFTTPAGATAIKFSKLSSQVQNAQVIPIPRRLVKATIGGQSFALHLDFGAAPSQLRTRSWAKAKLAESDLQLALVDEVGMLREIKQQGLAESVSVGAITTANVVFVPYGDRRWPEQDIDGTLGLGFFRPYSVAVSWDATTVYVAPRGDVAQTLQARIARWQSKTLTSCAQVGCVKVSVVDPLANKPPEERPEKHPGLVISVVRDPAASRLDLEVLIAVTPAAGKPPLRWFVANLPSGVDRAMTHVSADYLDASLTVVDAGLFPRKCPAEGGCIDRVEPPQK